MVAGGLKTPGDRRHIPILLDRMGGISAVPGRSSRSDPAYPIGLNLRQHGVVDRTDARRYLLRLAALHGAFLLFTTGIFIAVVGAPEVGVPALLIAIPVWVAGVLSAWVAAVRERDGKKWFGAQSVTEDASARMGWGQLGPASAALGVQSGVIRRTLLTTIVLTVAMVPAAAVAGVTIR